ncbi:MAG TPA: helix-turn-helix transcriptional regulator, partial [Ilumatobacteraceae bacterium]|nr:helix-turn-helix transcriptional regulator [Ilumatobacteraceae bacterium]
DALVELESRTEWSDAIFPIAMAGLSQLQLIVGKVEVALGSARAALDAVGPDLTKAPAQPSLAYANALAANGRLLDAIDAIREARVQIDAPTLYKAAMAFTYGELLSHHGRIDQARKAYAEAVLFAEAIDNRNLRTMALGSLAAMMGQLGESHAAAGLLAEVDDAELPFRTGSDERARGMAWALTATGRPAEARSIVASTASACQDAGEYWDALRLWIDSARLGAARDVLTRAKECAQHIDGPVAAAFIAFITAAATDDPSDLAKSGAELADLGYELLAAEAWTSAATGHRRDGDSRASSAALAKAASLAARCEGAVTVERIGAALYAPVVPLSAREREIALMAADGLSNQDIAERLVVSVRTVANHLQNAYVKLGVNRRSDLRDALSGE